jgi:hypothetical protein
MFERFFRRGEGENDIDIELEPPKKEVDIELEPPKKEVDIELKE